MISKYLQNCEVRRTDVLASLELGVLLARKDTEGVSTEVVTLCLQEVGRDDLAAVAVEERERGAERRSGDTPECRLCDDTSPTGLRLVHSCNAMSKNAKQ